MPDDQVDAWWATGGHESLRGHEVFTVDLPPTHGQAAPPVLLLHGFPTSSYDWWRLVPALRRHRRVLTLDQLGFGFSAKPDTVGGELLARELDGELPFRVRRRVLTNGSIYIAQADLRIGQRLLLALPDRRLPIGLPRRLLDKGLTDVFGPSSPPPPGELDAQWRLMRHGGGDRLMPRIIRYIRERQAREHRFTTAIEQHPAPCLVVWGGDDPVAVLPMAHRLVAAAVAETRLVVLDRVGHFPMVSAPVALVDEITAWLA